MEKRGFTLIELLAVIIILAIIALIATPIILNVIEDARKSAGKSEASMILSGINNYCATSAMKSQLDETEDICADGVTPDEVSEMVSIGNAEVLEVEYSNGKVTKLKVKSNNYEIELQPDGSFSINGKVTDLPKEPESFANDSWATIVNAVKNDNTSKYQVGDTKEVILTGYQNGDEATFTVRIANNSTPEECDGTDFSQTACGFVIEFVDVITTHNMNSTSTNRGGYPASAMYRFLRDDIYNALPEDLKNVIVDTKVVSSYSAKESVKANFISTDKLYLLATKEIWGNSDASSTINEDTSKDSTRQLDYYEDNGVSATVNRDKAVKNYQGEKIDLWTRSCAYDYYDGASSFFYVATSGVGTYNWARFTYGVAPAFRVG